MMNHSERWNDREITQCLGITPCSWLWTFSPRMLVVQCPSDSFTNEILNPRVTELTGFIWQSCLPLCQAVGSQGNRVLLHRCDYQAPTPGVKEYSQKRVTLVAFPVCGHYKARLASTALPQAQNTLEAGETSGKM